MKYVKPILLSCLLTVLFLTGHAKGTYSPTDTAFSKKRINAFQLAFEELYDLDTALHVCTAALKNSESQLVLQKSRTDSCDEARKATLAALVETGKQNAELFAHNEKLKDANKGLRTDRIGLLIFGGGSAILNGILIYKLITQ